MADASTQCYYLDSARNQQGPVTGADIARLVRSGAITRDTLMWYPGMADWRPAGQVSEFASLFGGPAAPTRPPQGAPPPMRGPAYGQTGSAGAQPSFAAQPGSGAQPGFAGATDHLVPDFTVWGLFWRWLVFSFFSAFLIPAPWCVAALYRYIIGHISLPDGRRLTFAGRGGEIWLWFIGPFLFAIVVGVLASFVRPVGYLNLLIDLFFVFVLPYLLIRWVCEKTGTDDDSMKLAFGGSIWGLAGFQLLMVLSYLTIIGWAWVAAAFMRWTCRNVSGTHHFEFAGGGLDILWRALVFVLVSVLILPIPWMMRWFYGWVVSQIRVTGHAATFD
jgi:hypothetical protein